MPRTTPLQRKTPLVTRTAIVRKAGLRPVGKKRAKAKRKPGSVEAFHVARVAALPCLVSGEMPVTVHHVTASIHAGRFTRSDRIIVPLAARYHLIQHGPRESVEALGHGGFYAKHGIDLLAEAHRLWRESFALWAEAQGLTTAAQMEAL